MGKVFVHKKEVVCMLGLKTCGKDYNAQRYIKELDYKKIALADPLRQTLWNILGYTPYDYQEFKTCDIKATHKTTLCKIFGLTETFKITTVRKLLQNVGSEFKRQFGQTFWANKWKEAVLKSDKDVVCTDVRFNYEVEKALSLTRKKCKVKFIWCCYEGADFDEILKDKHESERFNQFIYFNREKYGLQDGSTISHKTMRQILKDYQNYLSSIYGDSN